MIGPVALFNTVNTSPFKVIVKLEAALHIVNWS